MVFRRGIAALAALVTAAGCGGGNSGGGTGALPNVLPLSVDGTNCSSNSYPNKPCVTVTVCAPGTTNCQTIRDVLLDTGSTGFRVFRQALSVPLQQVTVGAGAVAECAQWGDATSDWGPVQLATLVLGGEPPVQTSIHVIDRTFGTPPGRCGTPEAGPAAAGFNGILGVGVFQQDCGPGCAPAPLGTPDNGIYYACVGATCTGTTVTLATQVQNPVALLPLDNNGVVVQLPPVPAGGARAVEGQLLLGIGTRSNNVPSSPRVMTLDEIGYLRTSFGGVTYPAYIDTGSNGLFFPATSSTALPTCSPPAQSWYCPASTVSLSATNFGAFGGGTSDTVTFSVSNYVTLASGVNSVFVEVAGTATTDAGFDWGLPFHFGRTVYVGFEGRPSSLGPGPLFAY